MTIDDGKDQTKAPLTARTLDSHFGDTFHEQDDEDEIATQLYDESDTDDRYTEDFEDPDSPNYRLKTHQQMQGKEKSSDHSSTLHTGIQAQGASEQLEVAKSPESIQSTISDVIVPMEDMDLLKKESALSNEHKFGIESRTISKTLKFSPEFQKKPNHDFAEDLGRLSTTSEANNLPDSCDTAQTRKISSKFAKVRTAITDVSNVISKLLPAKIASKASKLYLLNECVMFMLIER